MRKSKKIVVMSMTMVVGIIIILYLGGMFTNKQISDIPKKNQVSFIEIYGDSMNHLSKHPTIEDHKSISEIYNVLLSAKKNKTMQSVNDSPTNVNGKVTKIVLTDNDNNYTSLFAYEGNDGKYYIEKPYEGIYEISIEAYEIFTKYFVES